MENKKELKENNEEMLNKINTNLIFEFSKLCFNQWKLMEYMLKEENLKINEAVYEKSIR